jgi:hypothetical protein
MKNRLIAAGFLLGSFIIGQKSEAQVRVGVNINIGDQPSWRAQGYDYVEYYYLPDIECYYHVPRRQFIYLSNGRWVFAASLPVRYRSYDLHAGYKIVINRPHAYRYFEQDCKRYKGGNSFRNERYKPHDNGRHRGWSKNKRHGRH